MVPESEVSLFPEPETDTSDYFLLENKRVLKCIVCEVLCCTSLGPEWPCEASVPRRDPQAPAEAPREGAETQRTILRFAPTSPFSHGKALRPKAPSAGLERERVNTTAGVLVAPFVGRAAHACRCRSV